MNVHGTEHGRTWTAAHMDAHARLATFESQHSLVAVRSPVEDVFQRTRMSCNNDELEF